MEFRVRGHPPPQAISNHEMYVNRNRRPPPPAGTPGGFITMQVGSFPDESRAWARDGPPAMIDQSPLVDGGRPGFAEGERNTLERFNPRFTPGDRVRMPQDFFGGEGSNFDRAAEHRFTRENPAAQNMGTPMGARGFSTNVYEDY